VTPVRIAVLFAFATLAAGEGVRAAGAGSVYVTTLPSGADVWLDGTYVGRSPALVSGLEGGRHAVTLSKQGWNLREVSVAVAEGSIAMSSTALAASARVVTAGANGTLVLRNLPHGAKALLDGSPLRAAGAGAKGVPVAPGTHELRFVTPRGATHANIDVLAETTTTVFVPQAQAAAHHSGVVAPAEDYLPTDDFNVQGTKIAVTYGGHVVSGKLGDSTVRLDRTAVTYDSAPELIGGKLYLPLALLRVVSGDTSK